MEKNRKLQILKKIIKESVREVMHEDAFRQILQEELKNFNKSAVIRESQPGRQPNFPFTKQMKGITQPKISNPLEHMLKMTAENLDPGEYSNIQMNGGGMMENNTINSMPNMMNQQMMDSIGEIEDWSPSTQMNIPNFPR